MAKTMEIFKVVLLALVLVPLTGASSVEELEWKNEKLEAELAQLKEMFSALQERVTTVEDRLETVDSDVKLNDTEELEARVTVLEESVSDLEAGFVILTDEVDDVETVNTLQDQRLNTMEMELLDNDNDIEELVDITTGLTTQVTSLEQDVAGLDQRVGDLESGGGGSGNVTELEGRVETLEEVTSQLTDDVSSLEDNDVTQDERISSIEEDVTSLDQRVEDLESGGGGNGPDYSDSIFMAVLRTDQTSAQDPLIFDSDVINPGGHYSNATGKYTVPYDGVYQFSFHLTASDNNVFFYVKVDNSYTDCHVDYYGTEIYRSTTILLELVAGQTVHVDMNSGAYGDSIYYRTYFSGFLVRPN